MKKMYVCIPREYVSESNFAIQSMKDEITKGMINYYGKDLNTELFVGDYGTISVYFMDKPIYDNKEDNIKQTVIALCDRYLSSVNSSDFDFKFNYSRLNPNFDPSNIKSSSVPRTHEKGSQKANPTASAPKKSIEEFDYDKLSLSFSAEDPRYSFDQVILSDKTRNKIIEAVGVIEVENKVFDEWGLRNIMPFASSAMSFYGPPGTGKSMAAEAIAHRLNKKILRATYADIESKFHGEGPKMVKAIFKAAERDEAVLFLDEADSLLSKRLTSVSDGSAQAINSMRSQLLISLEDFKGITIFATNLVVNYDKAFLSRLINIEFTMPDKEMRAEIWNRHIKGDGICIPLSEDVNIMELAEKFEFCGRDIKNAVKKACVAVALKRRDSVTQADLINACEITSEESQKAIEAKDFTKSKPQLTKEQENELTAAMQKKIDSADVRKVENI